MKADWTNKHKDDKDTRKPMDPEQWVLNGCPSTEDELKKTSDPYQEQGKELLKLQVGETYYDEWLGEALHYDEDMEESLDEEEIEWNLWYINTILELNWALYEMQSSNDNESFTACLRHFGYQYDKLKSEPVTQKIENTARQKGYIKEGTTLRDAIYQYLETEEVASSKTVINSNETTNS